MILLGSKTYSEGKVKIHGTGEKRRVWRQLNLAGDINTHEIMAAKLSASNVTDCEVLPDLLKQTCGKINAISADDAYNTIRIKLAVPLIPLRKGVTFWERSHTRNLAVSYQKLYDSNQH
ncbi:transposase [Candidatus Enterovibrio altilux]|uniref:Mobile element protein n=1 Tax=Candidatus Enterovibrio altilux TaxID=1927128 RepID=A0A291B6Z7_9GAMM|nr:Mobile element protein [Candidatus Enterovibrio luxaltus]